LHSWRLADSASNRSLPDFDLAAATAQIDRITNPVAASGGGDAESLASAEGRVLETVELTDRAITLADYERLALATPGTSIARVAARANLHPGFPCFSAPGVVTVLVLPYLPLRRPEPSASLLRSVAGWLIPRRPIGTRVEVVGPEYRRITARAHVRALRGSVPQQVEAACVAALHAFFDPLSGGPEGSGWPFGRDVYRSEVMAVLDRTPGVDHVLSLALFSSGTSDPRCGNVCIGPLGLVDSGSHEISVT
jgi:predicted phage baseplate assembly protein